MRRSLVAESSCPVLLVRAGLRPGGLAPDDAGSTRYTWTIDRG